MVLLRGLCFFMVFIMFFSIYEKLNVPYVALVIPAMILCVAGITVMEIFIPEVQNDGPHKLLTVSYKLFLLYAIIPQLSANVTLVSGIRFIAKIKA